MEQTFFKVTGEREMSKLIPETETGSVASFVIQMTNIEQVYERTYDKIQDIFARIGLIFLFTTQQAKALKL